MTSQRLRPAVAPVARWRLESGLTVLHRESATLPLAAGTLLLHTGSASEASEKAGLTSLGAELLILGTRSRTASAIAQRMESIGASMGTQVSEDCLEMDFLAPAAQLNRALDVMGDVLQHPIFPSSEIEKERAQSLAALASRHDTLFAFAHDRFNELLYGSHAYGRPVDGFPETVKRLSRKDFQRWHHDEVRADRAILSLVTPFKTSYVRHLVARHLGGWRSPATPVPTRGAAPIPAPRNHTEQLQAPFQQAYFMTGLLAPKTSDPDYLALKLLNAIVGGGMSSRLFLQLRERLGLAYEVSSFFPSRLQSSQWVLYMGLPAERLELAKRKMNELLHELMDHGPTELEMKQAKQMIKGAFVMERQTRRRLCWQSAWWEFLGREPNYENQYVQKFDALTRTDLTRVARRLLSSPRISIEVVPRKGKS